MRITTFLLSMCMAFAATAQNKSPYIHKVYEYRPAPGQFVNELPEYESGDTQEDMNRKAEESIADENKVLISLGGYGGYVIFSFDHSVVNIAGQSDFRVWGNAFWAAGNPNPNASKRGGSCEPGIVMVSVDANNNSIPDDEWYELAGSEYNKPQTIKNYQLTYHKPDENKVKIPMSGYAFLNDITYIKWESNQGNEGYIYRNTFHSQPYYPQWITDETMLFEGTKLTDNYIDESGTGQYFVQYAYDYGYADNAPNNDPASEMNIDWAIDSNGNPVHLAKIDFVKVYTGVNQYCGWLGETSTEIMGAEDLHPNAVIESNSIQNNLADNLFTLLNNPIKEQLIIKSFETQQIDIHNITGVKVISYSLENGTNYIPCNHLPKGLYIITSKNKTIKFIKQ